MRNKETKAQDSVTTNPLLRHSLSFNPFPSPELGRHSYEMWCPRADTKVLKGALSRSPHWKVSTEQVKYVLFHIL